MSVISSMLADTFTSTFSGFSTIDIILTSPSVHNFIYSGRECLHFIEIINKCPATWQGTYHHVIYVYFVLWTLIFYSAGRGGEVKTLFPKYLFYSVFPCGVIFRIVFISKMILTDLFF